MLSLRPSTPLPLAILGLAIAACEATCPRGLILHGDVCVRDAADAEAQVEPSDAAASESGKPSADPGRLDASAKPDDMANAGAPSAGRAGGTAGAAGSGMTMPASNGGHEAGAGAPADAGVQVPSAAAGSGGSGNGSAPVMTTAGAAGSIETESGSGTAGSTSTPTGPGTATAGSGASPSCVAQEEVCDGRDNNCNGQVDEYVKNPCGGCAVLDHTPGSSCTAGSGTCQGTGHYECRGQEEVQCTAQAITPRNEACDGVDNNCNGQVDEGVLTTWYKDCDGDGYPAQGMGMDACAKPPAANGCDWTMRAPTSSDTDCNDQLEVAHPGADYSLPITRAGQSLPPAKDGSYDLDCDGSFEFSLTVSTGRIVAGQLELIPTCQENQNCIGREPACIDLFSFSGVPTCGQAYTVQSPCAGTLDAYVLCK